MESVIVETMNRPYGVAALAAFVIVFAALALYAGVVGFLADSGDSLHEVGALLFLIVGFMSAALGIGLWNLEEDARRCAIAFFGFPAIVGFIGVVWVLLHESPSFWDVLFEFALVTLVGLPAIYLMRSKVKTVFDQLVIVRLTLSR
jgi:hypothetical protein